MALESLFRADQPVVPVRGVHLDLKGTPPTFDRLLRLLEIFAACRYNAVLVEWEDAFPWKIDRRFRSETAYTPEEVRRFGARCGELDLEIVPLVQCLGHMETPLSPPGYEPLRELPHEARGLNPLAEGAGKLVADMVAEVLDASGPIRHLHLGGDEAWSLGTHPDTAAFVAEHGKAALYLRHVEPLCDALLARGVRPILWHDMMKRWDPPALRSLAAKADLCVWGYRGHPDSTAGHHSSEIIRHFVDSQVPLWGASAYKGASGEDADLTDNSIHTENAMGWAEVTPRFGLQGVFATAWSRYCTHNVASETLEASLDSLVNVAVILHDGAPPEGGIEACVQALGELGERQRFEASHAAMAKLAEARGYCWGHVRQLRQLVVSATQDARRRNGGYMTHCFRLLANAFRGAEVGAEMARKAYAGLIPDVWIERYLAERVEPLREELADIDARVRQLDPVGYAAVMAQLASKAP